jgi:hypothetical protein
MSDLAAELAWKIAPPGHVTLVQVVPLKCHVPAPGYPCPWVPNTQTSVGLIAVMPVKRVPVFQLPRGAASHLEPFRCST